MSDEIKVNSENTPRKNLATLGQVKDALDKRDEKIDSLKGDIDDIYPIEVHDKTTNYVDRTKLVVGYINKNGNLVTSDGLWATDFIEVLPNTVYYVGGFFSGYYAFYDENKTCIEGHGSDSSLGNSFTTPSNCKYVRLSTTVAHGKDTCWMFTENKRPKDYATKRAITEIEKKAITPLINEKVTEFTSDIEKK